MRICLFFLITVFLMACSSTGNQRQEPENQTLETILNRKSVRKYKDRPVEKEKIDKLIRAGMAAPSSRDRRPWEFIIVTDRKALLGFWIVPPPRKTCYLPPNPWDWELYGRLFTPIRTGLRSSGKSFGYRIISCR